MTSDEIDEVTQLAKNVARNCGFAVFPCNDKKQPARAKWQGGDGYKDASADPKHIDWLWLNWPGPLIGIATGATSGIDVFDADLKHDTALAWWRANEHRLPPTRAYRTPGGGAHLYFRNHPGLRCSAGLIAGRVCPGVDCRAEGGYAVFHFAAGLPCLDHSPPAPWPDWLIRDLQQPKGAPIRPRRAASFGAPDAPKAISGILNAVARAQEGSRNRVLYWAGKRLAERGIAPAKAEDMLLPAAVAAGLDAPGAIATIRSALR